MKSPDEKSTLLVPQTGRGVPPYFIAALLIAGCGIVLAAIFGFKLLKSSDSGGKAVEQAPPASTQTANLETEPPIVATRIVPPALPIDPPPLPPKAVEVPVVPLPVVEAENWDQAIELLPMVDAKRDSVAGLWHFAGQALIGEPAAYERLMIPYELPREYDLRVEFTREAGDFNPNRGAPSVNIIFPHENRNLIFRFDCYMNGYYSDFIKIQNHPDSVPNPSIVNGRKYTCVIKVRDKTLSAYRDGQLIRHIPVVEPMQDASADWRLPNQNCMGLASNWGQMAFHRVSLRAVTGRGQPMPPDPDAARLADTEYWKDAIDLLAEPKKTAAVVAGSWKFENGSAKVAATPKGMKEGSRLQFNFIPPEEYDFRIDYTRDEGKYDVTQILSANGQAFTWKLAVAGISLVSRIGDRRTLVVDNPFGLRIPKLDPNGQRHTSVVRVRRDCLRCYVDGKLCFYLRTDYANMHLEEYWPLRTPLALGIGVSEASATFHSAHLKAVTGTPTPIAPKP